MLSTPSALGRGTSLTILGGGPAGLAAAYYAARHHVPFSLYEASERVGGNCITFSHGPYLFDCGAHRLHTRDNTITRELSALMRGELVAVDAPSHVVSRGRRFDFPLAPLDLLRGLGPFATAAAAASLLRARVVGRDGARSFHDYALYTYGASIAERFLLNYSWKLWGHPCEQLSPQIAGCRLQGLDLRTFLLELLRGHAAKTRHLDGAFLYPRRGYGSICERLADAAGREHIRLSAPIVEVTHERGLLSAVTTRGGERVPVDHVISTLPLNALVQALSPPAPISIRTCAGGLRFRSLVLVALFIDKPRVGRSATVYFPDRVYRFTRVSEPRNRSDAMAPPGRTSLVAEIPCDRDDLVWRAADLSLVGEVVAALTELEWFSRGEVIGSTVRRITHAYPVLTLDVAANVARVLDYLGGFANLTVGGRNGAFTYSHLHDMVRHGRDAVAEHARTSSLRAQDNELVQMVYRRAE